MRALDAADKRSSTARKRGTVRVKVKAEPAGTAFDARIAKIARGSFEPAKLKWLLLYVWPDKLSAGLVQTLFEFLKSSRFVEHQAEHPTTQETHLLDTDIHGLVVRIAAKRSLEHWLRTASDTEVQVPKYTRRCNRGFAWLAAQPPAGVKGAKAKSESQQRVWLKQVCEDDQKAFATYHDNLAAWNAADPGTRGAKPKLRGASERWLLHRFLEAVIDLLRGLTKALSDFTDTKKYPGLTAEQALQKSWENASTTPQGSGFCAARTAADLQRPEWLSPTFVSDWGVMDVKTAGFAAEQTAHPLEDDGLTRVQRAAAKTAKVPQKRRARPRSPAAAGGGGGVARDGAPTKGTGSPELVQLAATALRCQARSGQRNEAVRFIGERVREALGDYLFAPKKVCKKANILFNRHLAAAADLDENTDALVSMQRRIELAPVDTILVDAARMLSHIDPHWGVEKWCRKLMISYEEVQKDPDDLDWSDDDEGLEDEHEAKRTRVGGDGDGDDDGDM